MVAAVISGPMPSPSMTTMLTGADEEAIMGIHLAHRDRMSAGKIADQHLIQRHSPVQRFFPRPHADLVHPALVDECSRGWAYAASPLETSRHRPLPCKNARPCRLPLTTPPPAQAIFSRSEERRVGKKCRSRW